MVSMVTSGKSSKVSNYAFFLPYLRGKSNKYFFFFNVSTLNKKAFKINEVPANRLLLDC